jgi:hypothetical protein
MYLKIVSWVPGSKNGRREQIFECSCVDVCKYSFTGKKEFEALSFALCGDISSIPTTWFLGGEPKDGTRMELLFIWMSDKQGVDHAMIATDVYAYAMNDDGKTIDKWECKVDTISPKELNRIKRAVEEVNQAEIETREFHGKLKPKTPEPLIVHGD